MNKLSFVLLFLLSSVFGHARLGETLPQLVERFGQPVFVQKEKHASSAAGRIIDLCDLYTFKQDDWFIQVSLVDKQSLKERYSKQGEWTTEQITTVLNANAQGAQWTETGKSELAKLAREWRRTDGGTASWGLGGGMTVTHPGYERNKAKKEAEAKAAAARQPKI